MCSDEEFQCVSRVHCLLSAQQKILWSMHFIGMPLNCLKTSLPEGLELIWLVGLVLQEEVSYLKLKTLVVHYM